MANPLQTQAFRRFGWVVLAFTLAVIVWGAFVRATGSGAGCGSHWPMCNGQVIPRAPESATIIEFTHRATSGLAFLLVLAQLVWALRAFPRGHRVRRAAAAAMFFMVTEALVGAGLVLFEMVAYNPSLGRAYWMSAHLVNTFALVACLTLVIWAAEPARPSSAAGRGARVAIGIALAGTLLVAASGSVAALGNTLFPSATLAEGIAQDFSPTAHLYLRLRVWHPVLALTLGIFILLLTAGLAARASDRSSRHTAVFVAVVVLVQLAAGLANLLLLAPVAMQLVHLLIADALWIGLVRLAAPVLWQGRTAVAAAPVAALPRAAG